MTYRMPRGRGGALGKLGLAISRSSLGDSYSATKTTLLPIHYPLITIHCFNTNGQERRARRFLPYTESMFLPATAVKLRKY
jgi:hypothetical protein